MIFFQNYWLQVLTLSNAACSSLFSSRLLVADASVWGTFLLGVAFRHVIYGFHLFFLPVRLPSEIRKLPPDPPVFSWCLDTSSIKTPLQKRISNSFVSLFIFYILSYLLSKTMGCFSGCLMSSASDQKLFCGVLFHNAVLLSVQMILRWICGGENGLPVLFLCHLSSSWLQYFKMKFFLSIYLSVF